MNLVAKTIVTLRAVANHPLNRNRKLAGMIEFAVAQVRARLRSGDICVDFPNGTRLKFSPRMKGAAHYISPRLCEFEEMAFVMHFLRDQDLFIDVGANLGWHAVHAAQHPSVEIVMAFEPDPFNAWLLDRNLTANGIENAIVSNAAVGARSSSTIEMSSSPSRGVTRTAIRAFLFDISVLPGLVRSGSVLTVGGGDCPQVVSSPPAPAFHPVTVQIPSQSGDALSH